MVDLNRCTFFCNIFKMHYLHLHAIYHWKSDETIFSDFIQLNPSESRKLLKYDLVFTTNYLTMVHLSLLSYLMKYAIKCKKYIFNAIFISDITISGNQFHL